MFENQALFILLGMAKPEPAWGATIAPTTAQAA